MNDKDHDFGDGTVCKNCGVERLHNTKKRFYMRDGRLVNEDKCDQRLVVPSEVHPSHDMGEPECQIRAPCGTPRFYTVRACKKCEFECGQHAAGKYTDEEMQEPCAGA